MDVFDVSEIISPNETLNSENDEELLEINKENVYTNTYVTNVSKHRVSRMSLLKCMDPLNPYLSPKPQDNDASFINQESFIKQESIIKQESFINQESLNLSFNVLNQSLNLMKLDTPNTTFTEAVDNDNEIELQSLNNGDILFSDDKTCQVVNIADDSQFLDISSDEDGVAVDDLLSMSPVRKFVDKAIHDKLKKYHRNKQNEWLMAEENYLKEIEQLKIEYEVKILALSIEKQTESNLLESKQQSDIIELLQDNVKKLNKQLNEKEQEIIELRNENEVNLLELRKEQESLITELLKENEENLEELRTNNCQLLTDKQDEINNFIHQINNLQHENDYLNCAKVADESIIDQYSDTIEELIHQHHQDIASIFQDNKDMEAMLNRYLMKLHSTNDIITSQQKNEVILREQLASYQSLLSQCQSDFNGKNYELSESVKNFEQEITSLKSDFDRKLKRKEIKIAMMENAEMILKSELELRIKERDQFKKSLADILEQN